MSLECLVGVLRVSGGCLETVSMVSVGCLESNWRVLPHTAPSWILSKAENLASTSLQDGRSGPICSKFWEGACVYIEGVLRISCGYLESVW